MDSSDLDVTIDEDCKLRALRPEVRERSAGVVEDCQLLVSKVRELQTVMTTIHAEMDRLAKDAERQRLKAMGPADEPGEEEALLSKIQAKEREAEEFASYLASLERAEGEQLAEIAELEGHGK